MDTVIQKPMTTSIYSEHRAIDLCMTKFIQQVIGALDDDDAIAELVSSYQESFDTVCSDINGGAPEPVCPADVDFQITLNKKIVLGIHTMIYDQYLTNFCSETMCVIICDCKVPI